LHHSQARTEEAEEFAERSQKDLERVAVLAGAMDLPRQRALAWTNLGWLYYYIGRQEELDESLRQAYEPFPTEYRFPANGSLPPMAERKKKSEATLPYWSTLGKAEMLKAYLALDQAFAASETEEQEAQLQTAVKHITLSLAYDELVADKYFDLTRAEEGLHKRILQDNLSIKMLHQYAQQVAGEQGLTQPTRFQQFLNRMFGPADLWK
jgi:tetratricopeptide (TPR) repeat protein